MQRKDEKSQDLKIILYKSTEKIVSKEEKTAVDKFFSDSLVSRPEGRLIKHGDYIVLVPHNCPIPQRSVFMAGVTVGEVKKGILFPHHQFFSAYGDLFLRREDIKKGDPRIHSYLRGEEIDPVQISGSGWCCVSYEGAALGGGKLSGDRIKNHYPKGLRNK